MFRLLTRLSSAALCLGLCIGAKAWPASRPCASEAAPPPAGFEAEAQRAFRQQRYAAAYGRYMRLADSGHVAAAELALLMYRQGPVLFGNDWSASDPQLACWRTLVINNLRHTPLMATDVDLIKAPQR